VQTQHPRANFGDIYIHFPSTILNDAASKNLLMDLKRRLSGNDKDNYYPRHDHFVGEAAGGTHLFVHQNELPTEDEGTIWRALADSNPAYSNANIEQMTSEQLATKYQEVINPASAQVQQPQAPIAKQAQKGGFFRLFGK
jgi:hypothetical protein